MASELGGRRTTATRVGPHLMALPSEGAGTSQAPAHSWVLVSVLGHGDGCGRALLQLNPAGLLLSL